jgi:hypothetical protein
LEVALLSEAVAVVGSFPTKSAAKGADERVPDEGLPEIRLHWDYRCESLSSSAALPFVFLSPAFDIPCRKVLQASNVGTKTSAMNEVVEVDSRALLGHSNADIADDASFMIDIDDQIWCHPPPPSPSSDAAEMARAEEKGPIDLQRLPTSTEPSEDAQPLQQHNEGIWPVDTLLAHPYSDLITLDLLRMYCATGARLLRRKKPACR